MLPALARLATMVKYSYLDDTEEESFGKGAIGAELNANCAIPQSLDSVPSAPLFPRLT